MVVNFMGFYDRSLREQIYFGFAILCAAMLLIAFFISAIFDTNKDYAQRYGVPESHVYILPKPTDCDWFRAPIGNKECHYEKQVIAEHVPQSGETTENIKKVTDVLVTWEKKED